MVDGVNVLKKLTVYRREKYFIKKNGGFHIIQETVLEQKLEFAKNVN